MRKYLTNLLSNSFVYGFTGVISKFIGMFLLPFYTRVFSPKDYGMLDMLSLFVYISVVIVTCGLDSALFRYFFDFEKEEEKRKVSSTIIIIVGLVSILFCLVLMAFRKPLSSLLFLSSEYEFYVFLALLQIPLTILATFTTSLLRIRFMPYWHTASVLIGLIITYTSSIYLILVIKMGIPGAIIGILIGNLVQISINIILNFRFLSAGFYFDKKFLKEIFTFGSNLLPANLAQWSLIYLNRYMLLVFVGLSAVGIYSVAYRICSIIFIINSAFQMAWPQFAFSIVNNQNSQKIYATVFKFFLLIMISTSAFIMTFSREIINIFTTNTYIGALTIIGLLLLGFTFSGGYYILSLGATLAKKTGKVSKALLFGTVINILFGVTLIPYFGTLGAVVAICIGYFITCIYMYKYSQKQYFIPYDIKRIVIMIINYLILYFITITFSESMHPIKIIACIVFYVLNYFIVLNKEEKNFFAQFFVGRLKSFLLIKGV